MSIYLVMAHALDGFVTQTMALMPAGPQVTARIAV
jgi:hypothetical protein